MGIRMTVTWNAGYMIGAPIGYFLFKNPINTIISHTISFTDTFWVLIAILFGIVIRLTVSWYECNSFKI